MESILDSVQVERTQPAVEQKARAIIETSADTGTGADYTIGEDTRPDAQEEYTRYPSGEMKVPEDFIDSFGTAFQSTWLTDVSVSKHVNSKTIYDEQLEYINEVLPDEEKFGMFSLPLSFSNSDYRASQEAAWRGGYEIAEDQKRYFEMVGKYNLMYSEEQRKYTDYRVKAEKKDLVAQDAVNPWMGSVAGSLVGTVVDPLIAATLPMGGPVVAETLTFKGLLGAAKVAAWQEFKIAAAAEVPLQLQVYDYKHNQLEMDYSATDAALQGMMGIGGATFIRGLGSSVIDGYNILRLPSKIRAEGTGLLTRLEDSDVVALYEEVMLPIINKDRIDAKVAEIDTPEYREELVAKDYVDEGATEEAFALEIRNEATDLLGIPRYTASRRLANQLYTSNPALGITEVSAILRDIKTIVKDVQLQAAAVRAGGAVDEVSAKEFADSVEKLKAKIPKDMHSLIDDMITLADIDGAGGLRIPSSNKIIDLNAKGWKALEKSYPELHTYLKKRMANSPHESLEDAVRHFRDNKYKLRSREDIEAEIKTYRNTNRAAQRTREGLISDDLFKLKFHKEDPRSAPVRSSDGDPYLPLTANQRRTIEPPKTARQEATYPEVDMKAPITKKERLDFDREATHAKNILEVEAIVKSTAYKDFVLAIRAAEAEAKALGKKLSKTKRQKITEETLGGEKLARYNTLKKSISNRKSRDRSKSKEDKAHKEVRMKKVTEKITGKKIHPTPREIENRLEPYKAMNDRMTPREQNINRADINRAREELSAGKIKQEAKDVLTNQEVAELQIFMELTEKSMDSNVGFKVHDGEIKLSIGGEPYTPKQLTAYTESIEDIMKKMGCM